MKKLTDIGGVPIGGGRLAICASLAARDENELLTLAGCADASRAQLIEWRADAFSGLTPGDVPALLARVREESRKPIIFTLRTDCGERLSDARYGELIISALAADAVDIEFSRIRCRELAREVRAYGARVIISTHDFSGTPPESTLLERIRMMREAGADIVKYAAMPRSPEDVLTLMSAGVKARREIPAVTVALGELGRVSRYWSASTDISFGSVGGVPTAIGQPDVAVLAALAY